MIYTHEVKPLVTNGPSKMDLVTALAYAYGKDRQPFWVTFELSQENLPGNAGAEFWNEMVKRNRGQFQAIISSLEHEDSSGDSFNIAGYLGFAPHPKHLDTRFTGYYSTKTRKGSLQFHVCSVDDKG